MSVEGIHLIVLPVGNADNAATAGAQLYAWWKVLAGRIVQNGRSGDIVSASGFTQDDKPGRATLLLSNDDVAVRLHEFADITPAQAVAAAQAEALRAAIGGGAGLHSAAIVTEQKESALRVMSAVVRRDVLQDRLAQLRDIGVDVDHIVPAAALMHAPNSGYACFALAGQNYLLGPDLAAADDRALRQALLIDQEPELLDGDSVDAALSNLPSAIVPDLRHGAFVKQTASAFLTPIRRKWLAVMAVALLVITLLIPAARLWIYSSAEDDAVSAVLAKVQADFPTVTDIGTARNMVDDALARRGAGASVFSVPTSALLRALEQSQGIILQELAYQPGGIVAAKIRAENTEDARIFMENIQTNQGFTLTCQQCDTPSETSGPVVFDIMVRG